MLTSDWRLAVGALAVIIVFELVPMIWDPVAESVGKRVRIATREGRNVGVRPTAPSFFKRFESATSRSRLLIGTAQILLVTLGTFGAIGHAFFRANYSRTLNLDIVTVAWVGLIAVGLILPELLGFRFEKADVNVERIREGAPHIEQTPDERGDPHAEALIIPGRTEETVF